MTHRIDSPSGYVEGESLTEEFTIEDDSGSAKDLSGASVSWDLLPTEGAPASAALVDDSDSGVSAAIVDAAAGRIDITLDQGVTDGLAGYQWQRLTVDDGGSGQQIWAGPFVIESS